MGVAPVAPATGASDLPTVSNATQLEAMSASSGHGHGGGFCAGKENGKYCKGQDNIVKCKHGEKKWHTKCGKKMRCEKRWWDKEPTCRFDRRLEESEEHEASASDLPTVSNATQLEAMSASSGHGHGGGFCAGKENGKYCKGQDNIVKCKHGEKKWHTKCGKKMRCEKRWW